MSDESEPLFPPQRSEKPEFLTQVPFEEHDIPEEILRGLADVSPGL